MEVESLNELAGKLKGKRVSYYYSAIVPVLLREMEPDEPMVWVYYHDGRPPSLRSSICAMNGLVD